MTIEEAMAAIIDALPNATDFSEHLDVLRSAITADNARIGEIMSERDALEAERDALEAERDEYKKKYEESDRKFRERFKSEFTGNRSAGTETHTDNFANTTSELRVEDLDIFNGATE